MGLIGNTLHAFGRLRAGKGFGIHSPFAYTFVKDVLRLPDTYGYYAYHEIAWLHHEAAHSGSAKPVSLKYLKMIFRIGNFFRSDRILIVGAAEPLTAASAATLDDSTRVTVLDPATDIRKNSLIKKSGRAKQISACDNPAKAAAFLAAGHDTADGRPLLIFALPCTAEHLDTLLAAAAQSQAILIVTRLKRNRAVWERITAAFTDHGMSFANPHIAVMVPEKGLPRQHFNLWI